MGLVQQELVLPSDERPPMCGAFASISLSDAAWGLSEALFFPLGKQRTATVSLRLMAGKETCPWGFCALSREEDLWAREGLLHLLLHPSRANLLLFAKR